MWAGLAPTEASLLGTDMASSPRVLTWLSFCACLGPYLLFLEGHQSHAMGTHPHDVILLQSPL